MYDEIATPLTIDCCLPNSLESFILVSLITWMHPFVILVTVWIWLIVVIYYVLRWRVDIVSSCPKPCITGKIFHPHDIGSKGIVGSGFLQVTLGKTKGRRPGMCQQWLFQIFDLSITSVIEMLPPLNESTMSPVSRATQSIAGQKKNLTGTWLS